MAWQTYPSFPLILAQSSDVTVDDSGIANTPAGTDATESVEGADSNGDTPTDQPSGGLFGGPTMMIFILVLVVMWVFLIGGQRKEKKKRAALLAALSKGDKVQTVGGVLGTVVEVRDSEVIVKVDENANTRMRFSRSAIQAVINDGEPVPEK